MANKKITDLTELTAAANDDYLEIVDTSANTSKKISHENLIASHDHDGTYIPLTNFVESTPTVTASSGTFTTVSCYARYLTIGKMRFYSGTVYIANAGSATGTLRVPIPTGTPAIMGGGKWVGSGFVGTNKSCFVTLLPTETYLEILSYDGATAIASGVSVAFSITYEIS